MSSIGEQGRRREVATTRGVEGQRIFYAPWEERYNIALPKIGDPYGDPLLPYLYCTSIEPEEDEAFGAIIVCKYTNEGQLGEEFYEYNAEFTADVFQTTGMGYVYEDTGTPVEVPISKIMPKVAEVISVRQVTSPREKIRSAIAKVNDRKFHGADAGHMLLEGASVRISRDQNGTVISAQSQFRFVWNERDHREVLREARQKTINGIPQVYQDDDPGGDYYADGVTHFDGEPVLVNGDLGTTAWTKIKRQGTSDEYLFGECDFATVLGLPIEPGDDVPGED